MSSEKWGGPEGGIGGLYLLGRVYAILGILAVILCLAAQQWLAIGLGMGLIWLGIVAHGLAGIWGTLERIARK